MYGCPYCKFDFKEMAEKCELTGELTNGAIMCDLEYEDCPHYECQHARDEQDKAYAAAQSGARLECFQQTIFGGEVKVK